ncbi:hypothetical protein DSO57_1038258 [Entomophthora muscae]|uniref:Uncharacterized protein n=1 Tax=Entomophthora muscae TaxID=34485 RepID=A0ACC2S0U3_9FUNG|nr:hypothetical protein DSO57_1038258 [Entomophthora muscae]
MSGLLLDWTPYTPGAEIPDGFFLYQNTVIPLPAFNAMSTQGFFQTAPPVILQNCGYHLQQVGKLESSQGGDDGVYGHQPTEDLSVYIVSPKAPGKVGQYVVHGVIHCNGERGMWRHQGRPGSGMGGV